MCALRVLAVVLVLLLTPATAAPLVVDDPAGDVEASGATSAGDVLFPEAADLRELRVWEEGKSMWFRLATEGAVPEHGDLRRPTVEWSFGNVSYRTIPLGNGGTRDDDKAALEFNVGGGWQGIRYVPAIWDADGKAYEVEVAKELIQDHLQVPLQPGDRLDAIRAELRQEAGWDGLEQGAWDQVPNEGPVHFDLEGGNVTTGQIFLSTPRPIRASNGEATSFVYPVLVTNRAQEDLTALLSFESNVGDWTIDHPVRIEVPAASAASVPVVLTMPFRHEHNRTQTFVLHVEDITNSKNRAAIELGVHWLRVAQPSGHHPTVYFHSGDGKLYINTEKTDGSADEWSIEGKPYSGYALWRAYLDPPLVLGLAAELNQVGLAQLTIESPITLEDPRIEVEVMRNCSQDCPDVLIASGEASAAVSADERVLLSVPLVPGPDAEHVPHKHGASLRIDIRLYYSNPNPSPGNDITAWKPRLWPTESEALLPLQEFHDGVDQAYSSLGLVEVTPVGAFEKRANPGDVTHFKANVTNRDDVSRVLQAKLAGANKGWVDLRGSSEFRVGAAKSIEVAMQLHVPPQATPGDILDFFLIVEDPDDITAGGLARFRLHIVDEADEDIKDAPLEASGKRSPAPLLVYVLVFAAMVRYHRSRRD